MIIAPHIYNVEPNPYKVGDAERYWSRTSSFLDKAE